MADHRYFEKVARFDYERIPERVVHARGGGAHGTFPVTNGERSEYATADAFSEEGERIGVFVRNRSAETSDYRYVSAVASNSLYESATDESSLIRKNTWTKLNEYFD